MDFQLVLVEQPAFNRFRELQMAAAAAWDANRSSGGADVVGQLAAVVAAQQAEVTRQGEVLNCLMEMVEDSMPTSAAHELLASFRAEVAESVKAGRLEAERSVAATCAALERQQSERAKAAERSVAATSAALEQQLDERLRTATDGVWAELRRVDAKLPGSAEQLNAKLKQVSERLEGAGRDIIELDSRLAAAEAGGSRQSAGEAKTEARLLALENGANRLATEATHAAAALCTKALAAERAQSVEADRAMSDRIDRLQQELAEAAAAATERDELARSLQTEGEERAEDCATLLSSASELGTEVGRLEAARAALETRQAKDLSQVWSELRKLEERLAGNAEEAADATAALRLQAGEESERTSVALAALTTELGEYPTRRDVEAACEAVRAAVRDSGGSGAGGADPVWRVSNLEMARAALQSELEVLQAEMKAGAAEVEERLRTIAAGVDETTERGVGRLDVALEAVKEQHKGVTETVAALERQHASRFAECVEGVAELETRLDASAREGRQAVASLEESLRDEIVGKLGVVSEDL